MHLTSLSHEPRTIPFARLKRFTTAEYFRLTEIGLFTPNDRVELLDGLLVNKMPHNRLHATALDLLEELLIALLVAPWTFRTQRPIVLSGDSIPEPDLVVVKGPKRRFFKQHPTSSDIALLVEVSDSTLEQDQGFKQTVYARDRIPEYWIVNLVDKTIEVYTQPRAGRHPGYRRMVSYESGASVPLRLDSQDLGTIDVRELLP